MLQDRIHFVIPGAPVAKGRARFRYTGKFIQAYTPAETRKAEDNIRYFVAKQWDARPLLDEPLRVEVYAFLPIPASWSKKKRHAVLAGEVMPTGKPDIDNYVKSAVDAMNTVIFRDDALIVDMIARKRYSDTPRLEIAVTRMSSITP